MPTLNWPRRHWNITVTRNCHGPQGSVTETQDATYIPKAGSEEQQIALWLNCVASYLRVHYEPEVSGSQLDGGPSSWTRGNVECMQCCWSAESSTKLQCVEDTDLCLKPDVALLQLDAHNEAYPAFSWRNITYFLELTSKDFSSRLRLQLTKLAYATFIVQPGCHFIIALSIANQLLHIHTFDHAGLSTLVGTTFIVTHAFLSVCCTL